MPPHVLTFTASSTCSLPAEAMQRVYEVEVDDNGWLLEDVLVVTVVNPLHFGSLGQDAKFFGTRTGAVLTFDIRDDVDFRLIEEIQSMGKLHFSGAATATASGETSTVTFNGRLGLNWPSWAPQPPMPTGLACTAADHRMVLVPIEGAGTRALACGSSAVTRE